MTTLTEQPQHLRALHIANETRYARARIKRSIRIGDLTVANVLLSPPPAMQRMTVGELLRTQHRWGRARVRRFCTRLAVNENRTLSHLTARQRALMVDALNRRQHR